MSRGVPNSLFNSDRKSTRLNSSHTVIYTLSLHDALPISLRQSVVHAVAELNSEFENLRQVVDEPWSPKFAIQFRSEEHTSELQSHSDLHSFPTRRSSDLPSTKRGSCRRRIE